MKTAKKKAKELVLKFNEFTVVETIHKPNGKIIEGYSYAKQCALIAVDEFEKQEAKLLGYNSDRYSSEYWQEVKNEIQKL